MKPLRLAFDLDETLGVPVLADQQMIGWHLRTGAAELLSRLLTHATLCLWSVSNRRYVNKALAAGLAQWFAETYSWDELPVRWKDVRQLQVDFLVDDSPHHRAEAEPFGLAHAYIVVPTYGSPEDVADPWAWVRLVETVLG